MNACKRKGRQARNARAAAGCLPTAPRAPAQSALEKLGFGSGRVGGLPTVRVRTFTLCRGRDSQWLPMPPSLEQSYSPPVVKSPWGAASWLLDARARSGEA